MNNSTLQIGSGLWNRLLASFTATPALFQEGGTLHTICRAHLPLLKAAAKLQTPSAPPPTARTAPAVALPPPSALLATMCAPDRQELARMEQRFNGLPTEAAKDAYLADLCSQVKTSAPVLPPIRQKDLPPGTLTVANFERLSPREKSEHCRNGGRLVD